MISEVGAPLRERVSPAFVLLLVVISATALFMRVYDLQGTPPGVHYDEIINGEMAEQALQQGPEYYYPRAGGREGLYHLFLAASLSLPLPSAWQLRLPSILLSLVGMLFSYLWVARAFGRWAAAVTLGLMAVSLWSVLMGRVALRATTVTPIAAVAAFLFVSFTRDGWQGRRSRLAALLGLGIVTGLSFYTYRAGSMIYVCYVLVALYLFIWHRRQAKPIIASLAIGLISAAPILLLYVTQPDVDPRFGQVALPWQALLNGDPLPVLRGVVDNAGMFFWRGDLESHYNFPGRPVFGPVSALLFVAGVVICIKRWKEPVCAFSLLWLVAGMAPGVFTIPAPSFVHTISAQGVVYVFPGIAVHLAYQRLREGGRDRAAGMVAAFVGVLILANGVWTFVDYFQRWPKMEEVRGFHQAQLAAIAHDLDQQVVPGPTAICSSVLNEEDSFWRSGRQTIRFMMDREETGIRWYDCGFAQIIPVGESKARFYFLSNATFGEWMSAPEEASTSPVDGGAQKITADTLQWRQELASQVSTASQFDSPVQFGEELTFMGYDLERQMVPAGGEVVLLTFWRVLAPMPPERSVFVHLMGPDGELLAQGDGFSVLSDTLIPGDVVVQLHRFAVPDGTAPGEYALAIGVYSRLGERPPLPLIANAQEQEGRLEITSISVYKP